MIVIDPRSRSTFSHLSFSSSPCLIPVLSARVTSGSSQGEVTSFRQQSLDFIVSEKSCALARHRESFDDIAGLVFNRSHSTAFLKICLMTVSLRFTVTGFKRFPSSAFHFSICQVVICARGVSPNSEANSSTMYFPVSQTLVPAGKLAVLFRQL